MLRRDFLKYSGLFLVSATIPGGLTACFFRREASQEYFPQGVASGDPTPGSVVLWTRAMAPGGSDSHDITVEVALEASFDTLVLQEMYPVERSNDYTIKIIVDNLDPDTFYYYRYINGEGEVSMTGRTLTAPASTDAVALRFAFVNCQDRGHGFYNAFRQMINDDIASPDEKKIRFILHLGDFIYETRDDPLQLPLDDALTPISGGLKDRFGDPRNLRPFPVGGETSHGVHYADSVADYRSLYQQYLSDETLQAARARWPFIHTWDDHEFSDDCWQTEANYESTGSKSSVDEPSQPRKVAANQAWFEYIPVNLIDQGAVDADLRHSKEFEFAEVGTTPNTTVNNDNMASNADNIAAINTLTLYRNFRFGQLLELVLTDNRSYRSDHAVPEEISGNQNIFFHPRMLLPLNLVNELDAGRTANNGDPDAFVVAGGPVLNPRFNSPAGTMLGTTQKAWLKQVLSRSAARWKAWGNSVPLMRFLVNLSALNTDPALPDVIASSDSWDGYAGERNELMAFLRENNVGNVVSLSGDVHAHFAGAVADNYDQVGSPNTMMEFVAGSLSSISMFAAVEQLSRRDNPSSTEEALRSLIIYGSTVPSSTSYVNNLNNTLLNGVASGLAAARTNSLEEIEAVRERAVNPHLAYADTEGHGYGVVDVDNDRFIVTLVTISHINSDTGTSSPGVMRQAIFTVPYTEPGQSPAMNGPTIIGTPPFPMK